MNTLYINIKGDDIKGTENMTVVGKPEDAIISKFYFKLVKSSGTLSSKPCLARIQMSRLR